MSTDSGNVVRLVTGDGRSVSTAVGSRLHSEYLARVQPSGSVADESANAESNTIEPLSGVPIKAVKSSKSTSVDVGADIKP